MKKIFPLTGKVQHYAWGGTDFIPALFHLANPDKKPFAEYWMGAHPSASSSLVPAGGVPQSLRSLIDGDPNGFIGQKVEARFGELPYLFKVLDVKDMLSIQVHPTKTEAEKGFDAEEKAGIPIDAPYRNYKDRNHKPEVMVALTECWLLHGFLVPEKLEQVLATVPELSFLEGYFSGADYKKLYQYVMELPQAEADKILKPLVEKELEAKKAGKLNPAQPGWWVVKLYAGKTLPEHFDKGIFSIYLFNIVNVHPGQAIFQAAGIPHAYLEGQMVELMANSDNVLRGGLTPKHVDVPELLKHTLFKGIVPHVMDGHERADGGEREYDCPVPDFGIASLTPDKTIQWHTTSLEIVLVIKGSLTLADKEESLTLKPGNIAAILVDSTVSAKSLEPGTLAYRAFVPAL